MKLASIIALAFVTLFSLSTANAQEVPAALNFKMKNIEGEEVSLSKYAGKVVVFVNVASKCGYTKQYKQLQELHENYADKGVAVVGVPCNQFGGQEPGTEADILAFCEEKFGVEFDLMSKVDVNGENQTPLYKHLTGLDLAPKGEGAVRWNFEKIVLDKTGTPIARFATKVSPDSKEFVSVIEKALAAESDSAAPGEVKPYSHESKKLGKTYYLFSKEVPLKNSDKVSTIYFFASDPNNEKGEPVAEVPADREVGETKTGMLVLRKKKDGADKKSDK
jgi:glutathione peroxidase